MELREYFESTEGTGALSTSSASGEVDCAIYARPHCMEDGTVAFIMADRLSHENVRENPRACYLFMEEGKGYRGKRLYLTKVREEKNSDKIEELRRKSAKKRGGSGDRFLVFFSVDRIRPLVGG